MKQVLYYLALVLIVPLLAVAGCQPAVSDGEGEMEIRLAPIHEVRVNIAESFPPQIFVYIKGGLADSCTVFNEVTTGRSGNTVNIRVTTKRPREEVCAQVYGYFEQNVALGTDFTSGMAYIINVNDQVTSFVMQ